MKLTPQVEALKQALPSYDFIAIDFETATHSPASACSLGFAAVRNLQVVGAAHMLIHPPHNQYHSMNISIHGITPHDTRHAPTFWQLWPQIAPLFSACPMLAHNARFDMSVLLGSLGERAHALAGNFPYYDTLQMVKGLVPGSRKLDACAAHFGVRLDHHHNAQADAVACAEIAIACLNHYGVKTLSEFSQQAPGTRCHWFHNLALSQSVQRPVYPHPRRAYPAPVNPREIVPATGIFDSLHPLYRKNIVFTGELRLPRREAMQMAVDAGAVLRNAISKTTHYLVVGQQDRLLVGPDGLSSKERRAQELLCAGQSQLQVICEEEFLALVATAPVEAAIP